jgi:hypothetical protein
VKVAYFTAGTVGAGHLVRGIALGRGLARAGFAAPGDVYRMFGPPLPFPVARERSDYEPVEVQNDRTLRDRHLAQTSDLAQRLHAFAPDLLVVDLFWAPLYWVLPTLPCDTWLLVRTCPPVWLTGPREMPFDPDAFDRIIGIEPLGYPQLDLVIDPVVVANPDECRPPGALKERFGIPAGERLTVVAHAGERGEAAVLAEQAAGEGRVVRLDLFAPSAPFPAAEWLSGADRIVCGAGYNAYWEARWLGYAERTAFVPFRRSIDDQTLRLSAFRDHVPRANGADVLARWITG